RLDRRLVAVEQVPGAGVAVAVGIQQGRVSIGGVVDVGDVVVRELAADLAVFLRGHGGFVEIDAARLAVRDSGRGRLVRRTPVDVADAAEGIAGQRGAVGAGQLGPGQGCRAAIHAVGRELLAAVCADGEGHE